MGRFSKTLANNGIPHLYDPHDFADKLFKLVDQRELQDQTGAADLAWAARGQEDKKSVRREQIAREKKLKTIKIAESWLVLAYIFSLVKHWPICGAVLTLDF